MQANDPDDNKWIYSITSLPLKGNLYYGSTLINSTYSFQNFTSNVTIVYVAPLYLVGSPLASFTWQCRDAGGLSLNSPVKSLLLIFNQLGRRTNFGVVSESSTFN